MSKYIDTEKFYKKVDELMSHYAKVEKDVKNDIWLSLSYRAKVKMCSEIIDIITSLQQEQPEVDLEKEVNRWKDEHGIVGMDVLWLDFARHIYGLGLNARKEETK